MMKKCKIWEIVIFDEMENVIDRKMIENEKPVSILRAFGDYEKLYGKIGVNCWYDGNMIF